VESPAAPAQPGRSRDPLDKAIHDVLTPAPPLDEARAFICWRAGLSEPSSSMRERNGGMRSAAAPEYLELWSARSLPCHGRCLRSILFAVEGSAAHLCVPSLTDTDVSLPPRSVRHDGSGFCRPGPGELPNLPTSGSFDVFRVFFSLQTETLDVQLSTHR